MRKYLPRIIIYSLLLIACLLSYFSMINLHNKSVELTAKEKTIQQDAKNFNTTVKAFQNLEKKKQEYIAKGVITSSLDTDFVQIRSWVFVKSDYKSANKLITQTNTNLDKLLADYNNQQTQIAQENTKGDLSGKITCAAVKCPSKVSVKLLTGSTAAASTQTDDSGNYSFHIKAGKYNLSASLTGYTSIYKANLEVVSQQQQTVNLNLAKIVATKTNQKTPTSSPPKITPVPPTKPTTNDYDTFLKLINDYRASNHLVALSYDPLLNTAAQRHTDWMASTGNFSHTGENNSLPWDRCRAAGTTCSAEIIAYDGSVQGAFYLWQNSPGHNAIMLGSGYHYIGLGVNDGYFTVDFR